MRMHRRLVMRITNLLSAIIHQLSRSAMSLFVVWRWFSNFIAQVKNRDLQELFIGWRHSSTNPTYSQFKLYSSYNQLHFGFCSSPSIKSAISHFQYLVTLRVSCCRESVAWELHTRSIASFWRTFCACRWPFFGRTRTGEFCRGARKTLMWLTGHSRDRWTRSLSSCFR